MALNARQEALSIFNSLKKPVINAWDDLKGQVNTFLPPHPLSQKPLNAPGTTWQDLTNEIGRTLPAIAKKTEPLLQYIDFGASKIKPYVNSAFQTLGKVSDTLGKAESAIGKRAYEGFVNSDFARNAQKSYKLDQQYFQGKIPKNEYVSKSYDYTMPTVMGFTGGGLASKTKGFLNQIGQQEATKKIPGIMYSTSKKVAEGGKPDYFRSFVDTVKNKFNAIRGAKDSTGQSDTFDDFMRKGTPPEFKVNILDRISSTPQNVLEKIGFGNEAKLISKKYDDYLDELPKEINRITEWSKRVPAESNPRIFKYLDGQSIQLQPEEQKVANEIKDYLSSWAQRLKLPKEKKITNYITHIFPKGEAQEFPDEFAKLIRDKVAGSVYDPFVLKRMGKLGFIEDTWQALDAYVKRATRKVHMDEVLGKVKEKAEGLEDSQYRYVKSYIDRINLRPTNLDTETDNLIKSVIGYKFGARPVADITQKARQMVYRGLLGLNPKVALLNLTQGSNTYAKLGEKYTLLGYSKVVQNLPKFLLNKDTELNAVGVLRDNIVQDRTINATRKFWENLDKGLFYMFDLAEKINRGAAYWGAKSKAISQGMPEEKAIQYAKDIVAKTQFKFGAVETPIALQSDLSKTLTQFQSYSIKQLEFLGDMVKQRNFAGMVRWAVANFLLLNTIGKLWGMKPTDLIPSFRIGAPPTLQLPLGIGEAVAGTPDKFGNPPDENIINRFLENKNIQKGLTNYIPAGGQITKTAEALKAISEGGSFTESGQLRFEVSPSVEPLVFGIWKTKEAQDYLNKKKQLDLSSEEKNAKKFEEEERKLDAEQTKLAHKMYTQLRNLKTVDERKELLKAWEDQGLLDEDLERSIKSFSKSQKIEKSSPFSKAVYRLDKNTSKAKFIKQYFKNKSVAEKKDLLRQLQNVGLLTDDLKEKLRSRNSD